jgi:NodT family efflux transporter outer membrane factor (OMF) lipoprotein
VKTETDGLSILQKRFALGGVSQVDVLQQQATRDQEAALLPGLQKELEQERNQIAIYLGTQPGNYAEPTIDLASLNLPGELPVSVPSRLVAQRPDIQAYAALLHAATANVGVATANMLPNFSITGTYGREAGTVAALFTPAGLVASIAGSLTQPIFEGGTLLARRRSAVAAMQVAAAQYSSTLNSAFQNVANALVAIQRDAETLQASQVSEQTAAAALAVARGIYAAGGGTFINVLTAEQTEESARLTLVSARAARFTDTVALFQALGGGWWNRDDVEPKVAQCCGVLP